jgi:hypothetical protein
VLRGLKRYSEAQEILESLPESDDTIAMRENRLIVLERLGRNVEFDRLSRNLDVVLARGCGKASRIAVAVARTMRAGERIGKPNESSNSC